MTQTEFLQRVVADQGRLCVVSIKDKMPRHYYFDNPQDAVERINSLVAEGKDVYFTPATFKDDDRKADNAHSLKSFFIDLDCGAEKAAEGKGYEDQEDAVVALKKFVKTHGLPRPMVANSGRGVHAYWVLNTAVPLVDWKPVALGLKKLCIDNGLIIDSAVTADAARLLRPIGTKNFKDPADPRDVTLWFDAPSVDIQDIRNVVPVQVAAPIVRREMDATTKALLGNKVSYFKNIAIKTGEGNGCAQIAHAMNNQATIDEPLWRAVLSIAWTCEDRDTAIHRVSDQHPDYNEIETLKKAQLTQGPYLCATFETTNPGGCDGCQHRGKIHSPIRLCEEVLVATPEQNLVEAEVIDEQGVSQVVTVQIPEYPDPFFRGPQGGVYMRKKTPDGANDDAQIYCHDFYITKRMTDPDKGEVLMAMLHLPKDGVRSFSIPLMDAVSKDRLRDRVSMYGLAAKNKEWDGIMAYVTAWTNTLQAEEEAELSRTQFGWADDGSTFILGDQELKGAGKVRYSPPSSSTLQIVPMIKKMGNLAEWKSVVNMYARPGNEVRAFAFFMGFGAPLLQYSPVELKGALLNLMSPESGTGKSTIQMAINSIYGKPYDLLLQKADTINARIHRIGIMNNLPVTIDEITNMSPEHMSELAYAITQGRGKERMKAQGNELRINNTRWCTLVVSSSNSRIYDKLATLKESPDGEIKRVLEFKVDRDMSMTKEESDATFAKLYKNYGIAGETYINYLLDNEATIRQTMADVKRKVDKAANLDSTERFWSALITCAIVGGIVSRQLGLHDIDPRPILKWVSGALTPMRIEAVTTKSDALEQLGLFLLEHTRNTLVIDNAPHSSGFFNAPLKEPYGELLVRSEPDTNKIYISTSHLKKWCAERQISYKDMLDELEAKGVCERGIKKRLSTGTKLPGTTVNTLRIDATKGGFGIDEIAGAEPADDQR